MVAEMRHDRHLRFARDLFGGDHATAVVRHGGAQAAEFFGRLPGEQAAEAEADDADLAAAGLGHVVDGCLDVLHDPRAWQGHHGGFQCNAGLHGGFVVAGVHALFNPLEDGRRNRQVALGGEAVGDLLDVRIHAKDFLQDNHGGLGLARRLGHVRGESEAVCGLEVDEFTHGVCS